MRALWLTVIFGLAAAVITWDRVLVSPTLGLDASWILGLNLAAADGIDHGTDFVFTYGPLGFLEEPLVVDGLLAPLSALHLLALRAALAASLLWSAARSLPWPAAALLALAATAVTPRAIVALALTAVWCLVALQDSAPRWAGRLVVLGGGVLAAIELLVKLNVGVTILAIVVVSALALPGPRARKLVTLAAVFAGAFSILWFAGGQGVGNLDDYARSAFEVVSGYSETAQADAPAVSWDGWAALVAGLATIGAAVFASIRLPAVRRVAVVVVVAMLVFSLAKSGFVRHDTGHVAAFFGGLGGVWIALRWQGAARLAPCVAVLALVVAFFPTTGRSVDDVIVPGPAIDQLRTLLVPGEREQARDEARRSLRAAYALDPRIIERIGDAPVDARPWEIGLIWAHELNWRPLPVIQDYLAHTPQLDRLNAQALAAEEGPRFVLRHLGFGSPRIGPDGRFIPFDAPEEARVMLCRFRAVITTEVHQLLVRGRDRCGEPRPLGSVTASYGERVAVPAARPGEAVFARIDGATASGLERLRTLLYRAAIRRIGLDEQTFRFTPRNAESGLLISAPPDLDFPAPFALAPGATTIAVGSEGGFATSEGPLEVEFHAVPLRRR